MNITGIKLVKSAQALFEGDIDRLGLTEGRFSSPAAFLQLV